MTVQDWHQYDLLMFTNTSVSAAKRNLLKWEIRKRCF